MGIPNQVPVNVPGQKAIGEPPQKRCHVDYLAVRSAHCSEAAAAADD
jgi:hypothetical protein